jgi:hypothetical protein
MTRQVNNVLRWLREQAPVVDGLWGNSQNLAALFALSFVARVAVLALDQDLAVAAASSELIVGIAVKMAPDGAISLLETVQYALAALTLVQALHRALAAVHPAPHPAPHPVVAVAASGVVAVAIVAMTAQVGATSRAPIAQHALGPSTVVLRHRHADELVESDKPSGGILATCR